jgi:hypothetical protein
VRARRLLLAICFAACLAGVIGASPAAAQPSRDDATGEPRAIEARIREAVGAYGFVCAGGVQLAVLVVFVLARGRSRRAR